MTPRAWLAIFACAAAPFAPLTAQTAPGTPTPPAPPAAPAPAQPPVTQPAPTAPQPMPQPAQPAKPKLSPLTPAPDWKALEAFSGVLTKEEFDAALKGFYLESSNTTAVPQPLKPTPVAPSIPPPPSDSAASVQKPGGANPDDEWIVDLPNQPISEVLYRYFEMSGKNVLYDPSLERLHVAVISPKKLTHLQGMEFIEKELLRSGIILVPSGQDTVKALPADHGHAPAIESGSLKPLPQIELSHVSGSQQKHTAPRPPDKKSVPHREPVPWQEDFEGISVETEFGKPPVTINFRRSSSTGSPNFVPHYWHLPQELPKPKSSDEPLAGLQIALDPGHIGGAYAKMEERWLQMDGMQPVMEGQLTLATALYLKPRLEALGAHVTMVRSQEAPVTTAKPEDLREAAREVLHEAGIANPREDYAGVTGDAKVLTVQWQAEKLFYRVSEIRARAHKVNDEIKPDLVICLHYDADEWGDPNKPSFVPNNHFHLIVNGCYSPGELAYEDVRFEMLQRLFQGIHTEELRVGDVVAHTMAESTGLPPRTYTSHNARRVNDDPYVWARNLLANRLYQCPVIYLEPYVMNNEETYKRLNLGYYIGKTLLGDKLVTSPMEDYVRGIVNGLKQYYTQARHLTP